MKEKFAYNSDINGVTQQGNTTINKEEAIRMFGKEKVDSLLYNDRWEQGGWQEMYKDGVRYNLFLVS